jgi:hypothetical protein
MLSEDDLDYLERRRKSLRYLKVATWGLPLLWISCIAFAATRFPALVDPLGISASLDGGIVDWNLVRSLARVTPILFLSLILLITGTVFIFLRAAYRERRLLDLVERAERGSVSPHS